MAFIHELHFTDLILGLQVGVELQCIFAGSVVIGNLAIIIAIWLAAELANQHFAPPMQILTRHI